MLCFAQPVLWRSCALEILCFAHPVLCTSCPLEILCFGESVLCTCCALHILCSGYPVLWRSCALDIQCFALPVLCTSCALHSLSGVHDHCSSASLSVEDGRLWDAQEALPGVPGRTENGRLWDAQEGLSGMPGRDSRGDRIRGALVSSGRTRALPARLPQGTAEGRSRGVQICLDPVR